MSNGKKETLLAFGYNLGSKFVTYCLLLIFANLYLPEDYGLGSFVLNLRNILLLIPLFGIPEALIPFIIKKKDTSHIVKLLFIFNLVIFIVGLVAIKFYGSWIWPLVITLPMVWMTSVCVAFWRARSEYQISYKIGFYSIIITALFAYLCKDYGKFGVIVAYSIGNLFSFFFVVYPIKKELVIQLSGKWSVKEILPKSRKYLKNGLLVALIASAFSFMTWIDSSILGFYGYFAEVANFNVASSIASIVSIIPIVLSMFIMNRASQISNEKKALKVLHRVTRVSFFTTLISSLLIIILLPLLIKIFFPSYEGIRLYIMFLLLGTIFFSSYYIIYSYHIGRMKIEKLFPAIGIGLISHTIIVLLSVKNYGLLGVSLANVFSHFAILAVIVLANKEGMKRILFASAIAIIILPLVYYLSYWGIGVLLLTVPICILLKVITISDLETIRENIYSFFKR